MDSFGGVQIQGVATCLFLCMNTCGLLYGAMQSSEECLFRENIEQDNYNTYSSVRHSNSRKTLYLALDGRGSSRKVQITAARQKRQQQLAAGGGGSYSNASLGKLSTYARVLTRTVSTDRVEDLVKRLLINRQRQQLLNISDSFESDRSVDSGLAFRHHGYHHLCPVKPSFVTPSPTPGRTPVSRCPKKAKTPIRKKRKKKCSDEEDPDKCKREKRKKMQQKKKGGNNNMKAPGPKRKKQRGLLASRQTNRTTTVSVSAVPTIESSSIASD
ncbi:hypothetical protein B566_EDAN009425 [Ephemera danica]|nr:hypothetical protein B566_EDAN009425 [Ephemera danica]